MHEQEYIVLQLENYILKFRENCDLLQFERNIIYPGVERSRESLETRAA